MGKADDFLNSDEALAIAAQADAEAGGNQPPVTVDQGLQHTSEIPAQVDPQIQAAEQQQYQPLGHQERGAFPHLDRQAQEQAAAQAAAQAQQLPAGQTPGQVPGQAQSAAQQQAQAAIRDWLVNQHGLAGLAGAPDDQAAVQQVLDYAIGRNQYAQQAGQQLQQLAAQNQILMQQLQLAQQGPAAQQQAQPAAAAPPAFTPPSWLKRPEWDPALEAGLMKNENGEIVAKPGYAADLPQRYLAARAWRDQTLDRILSDPAAFAKDTGILHAAEQAQQQQIQSLRDELKKEFQSQLASYADHTFGQRIAQEHGDWMFQQGLDGRPMYDPNGRPVFSQEGQQVFQAADYFQRQFNMAPQQAWQMAYQKVSGQGSLAEHAAHELGQEVAALRAQLTAAGIQPGIPNGQPATVPFQQPGQAFNPQLNPAAQQQAANARFMQNANQAQQMTRQPLRQPGPPPGTDAVLNKYAQLAKNGDRESAIGQMLEDMVYNPQTRQLLEQNAA